MSLKKIFNVNLSCVKDVGNKSDLVSVGKWRYEVAPYRGHLLASDWIIIVHNELVWEVLLNKLSKNINRMFYTM